jgi:dTDP-4-amino-4,6-dideoxygalactose transaminase
LGADCPASLASLYLTSGRAGLGVALQQAGIQEGDEILVPAFHCESMVAPVHWRGAHPVFYNVGEDTRLDFADLALRVSPRTRALVAVHYFGFPQDVRRIREFCDAHDLLMIEDCAHALTGRPDGVCLGSLADYAIGSLMKFFPVFDGGFVASSRHSLEEVSVRPPRATTSFKAMLNSVELSIDYGRLGPAGQAARAGIGLKNLLWEGFKRWRGKPEIATSPGSSEGGYEFDPAWVDVSMTSFSRWVFRHTDWTGLVERRRANYRRLEAALGDLNGLRSLFPELPDHVTPLVYPVYVDRPEELFPRLKWQGIPIWRFGEFLYPEVTADQFPASVRLSGHLFQFPVHQELREKEIEWLIRTVRQALAN